MFRVTMLVGLCLWCSVASAQYPFSNYYYYLPPPPPVTSPAPVIPSYWTAYSAETTALSAQATASYAQGAAMMRLWMAKDARKQKLDAIPAADVSAGDERWGQAMEMVNAADAQKAYSGTMLVCGQYALSMYWWAAAQGYFGPAAEGLGLAADMYDLAAGVAEQAEKLYREAS